MDLSTDLMSQFVKATKDDTKTKKESTHYGTVKEYDGRTYVQLDGSELLTPVDKTTNAEDGERVTVMLKDHSATITGNISSPSARTEEVEEIGDQITEVEFLVADKVSTKELEATNGRIDNLVSDNVTIRGELDANKATINELKTENATITGKLNANKAEIDNLKTNKLDAEVADIKYATITKLDATNAQINNLNATYGNFQQLTTTRLDAAEANITDLEANKANVKDLESQYANIDFSNIGEAAMENFYAKSGLIQDVEIGDATITGTLVGVTIKGDLIQGGTIVADKLVIQGEDGLYYKLNTDGESIETEQTEYNSLDGSIITAKSITATKISVDDLVAFDATIGGFKITESSLYSGVKESADNTTRGVYMDDEGQLVVGDSNNFFKYYKDAEGNYILDISTVSAAEERLNNTIQTEKTEIITTTQGMISTSLETYVESDEYETFKKTTQSSLEQTNDKIELNFTTTTERIDEVDGDVQAKFTELSKHITFSGDNAITISSGDNSIVLEIDNEKGIVFKKNGEQFGLWDGVDFYTGNIIVEVNERAQLGNFAFIPRSDGSLSFLHVTTITQENEEPSEEYALTIVTHPANKSAAGGSTVTFTIEASGDGVTYQWQSTSTPTSTVSTWSDIDGAIHSSLSVTASKYSPLTMSYRCKVKDQYGNTATSNYATLTVTS